MEIYRRIRCPKCSKKLLGRIKIKRTLFGVSIDEVEFSCNECISYIYQYAMISCDKEMSCYKNDYTDEIHNVIKELKTKLESELK